MFETIQLPLCPSCKKELGLLLYRPPEGARIKMIYWCEICQEPHKKSEFKNV